MKRILLRARSSLASIIVGVVAAGTASAGVPIDSLNSASAGVNPASAATPGPAQAGQPERRGPAAALRRMAERQRRDDARASPDADSPPPLDPVHDR